MKSEESKKVKVLNVSFLENNVFLNILIYFFGLL